MYGVEGTLQAVGFDVDTLELTGRPVPVLEAVNTKNSGGVDFDVSDVGSLLYVEGRDSARSCG